MASGGMIYTSFHYDQFRNSRNIKINTSTICDTVMLELLMGKIYEICRCDGTGGTKFHKDRFRRQILI
jgi:hypothetical protein